MDNYSFFTNIRSEILSQLHKAKKEVLIAMAWFTNKDLFEACLDCLKRGVKVELILLDDLINHCDFGVNFNQFIELEGGKFYLYPQTKNFLHHKLCIIDSNILITGSYNWTNYAETRNLENIVISNDPQLSKSYTKYFYTLKNELEQKREFEIFNAAQIPEKEFVRRAKDLAEEVCSLHRDNSHKFYKQFEEWIDRLEIAIREDLVHRVDSSNELSKEDNGGGNTNVEVIKVENFKYAVSKYNIGFKANLLDQGGKEGLKVMINKGQVLPYSVICNAQSYDAGESDSMHSSCEFYYGDSIEISRCRRFGNTLTLNNLPKMDAGRVKFKMMLTLDDKGNLSTKFVCTNTGEGVESKQFNDDFIEFHHS